MYIYIYVCIEFFSCACWPSVYLLWENVYSVLYIFYMDCLVFDSELCELFIYFAYEPLFGYIISKYFLPFNGFLILSMISFAV